MRILLKQQDKQMYLIKPKILEAEDEVQINGKAIK